MFGGLFSTIFGKIAAVVVAVGGVAGGISATGAMSTLGVFDGSVPSVTAAGPAAVVLPMQGGTPLSFPDLPELHQAAIDRGAQTLASTASNRAVRVASQAESTAAKAAAAAKKCLDGLTAQVNALVAGIPNITNQEQAAAMVSRAKTIGDSATACAKQATALGQQGVDQVNQAAAQLNSAVAQIGSLNLQDAGQAVQGAQNVVGTAAKNVDSASGSALGMFSQITDMAAALMATAMDYQQKFQTSPVPVTDVPASNPAQPAPAGGTNQFSEWGNFSSWMDFAARMQQFYGTDVSTGENDGSTWSAGTTTRRSGR